MWRKKEREKIQRWIQNRIWMQNEHEWCFQPWGGTESHCGIIKKITVHDVWEVEQKQRNRTDGHFSLWGIHWGDGAGYGEQSLENYNNLRLGDQLSITGDDGHRGRKRTAEAGKHCLTTCELLILDHSGLKPVACLSHTGWPDQSRSRTCAGVGRGVTVNAVGNWENKEVQD